jgi:hypothetical protein
MQVYLLSTSEIGELRVPEPLRLRRGYPDPQRPGLYSKSHISHLPL